jgi:hypothetical protein
MRNSIKRVITSIDHEKNQLLLFLHNLVNEYEFVCVQLGEVDWKITSLLRD